MRSASILTLLLAAGASDARQRLSAEQFRASSLRGNLLLIAERQQSLVPTVTVCLVSDPNRVIVDAAEVFVNRIFAGIRVKLRWYEPPVCPAGADDPVLVTLETTTPAARHPGALGIALPLEGSHAWVFYDRVLQARGGDNYVAALLGHVMAHEIAHVLQGINRHSESGILKANWSVTDCARMVSIPLMFTREDEILIHRGLEERRTRLVSSGSGGVPANGSDAIGAPREMSLPLP
jgi:hypothetical protein